MPKAPFSDSHDIVIAELVALRKSRRISQVELARRLGKPQQFVSRVELGLRRIDIIEFYAIVRALQAEPAEVFAGIAGALPFQVEI